MTPTDEQLHILDQAKGTDNLMIDALAGTGKTTTIEMVERSIKTKPILYLAFSKKVKEEAEERMLSTTTVRTFNGQGHKVWAQSCGKNLSLNGKKTQDQLRDLINSSPRAAQGPIWDSFWDIVHGVGLAKALGYIPEGKYPHAKRLITTSAFHASLEQPPDDLVADLIDALLVISIKTAYEGFVDYNDQVYMPALFGGTFPRFPLVCVDEYQDLNPTNHALLSRLVKHRIIGVGDPWQNIYGFRGAKAGGMDEARKAYSMTSLNLASSFRCPRAIVENARWRVPHFKWIKEGGHVETLKQLSVGDIHNEATFLCRNNAPLFHVAMHLLASGRSVQVAGSDIGPKLIAIMRKLADDSAPRDTVISAIKDWLAEKLEKGSSSAQDLADCMIVFAGFGATLGQALSYATHLFAQKGSIKLLTGHKAKGLEWDCVYHLDPWLLKDDEQDMNLRYVIQTRSKNLYMEINSARIQW